MHHNMKYNQKSRNNSAIFSKFSFQIFLSGRRHRVSSDRHTSAWGLRLGHDANVLWVQFPFGTRKTG